MSSAASGPERQRAAVPSRARKSGRRARPSAALAARRVRRRCPGRGSAAAPRRRASTIRGASPSEGSSSSRTSWIRDERPRDRELLLLSAGEGAGVSAAVLLDDREELVDAARGPRPPPRRVRRPARPSRRFSSTLSSAKIRRPSGTSAIPRGLCPPAVGRRRDSPSRRTSPARWPDESHDCVQRRRLSRAVRTDQADDLATVDLEREARVRRRLRRAGPRGPRRRGRGALTSSCTALSPRYAAATSRLARMSVGVPSASVRPWSRTWIRSQTSMISAMLWSISRIARAFARPGRSGQPRRTPSPRSPAGRRQVRRAGGSAGSSRARARRRAGARRPARACRPARPPDRIARAARARAPHAPAPREARAPTPSAATSTFSRTDSARNAWLCWNVRARPGRPRRLGRPARDVSTLQLDGAGRRPVEPAQDVHEGRLAGAVRADQPDDLSAAAARA